MAVTFTRSGALVVRVEMEGVRETLRAFNELERDANRDLREETLKISIDLRGDIRDAAIRDGAQSALMARTVKARLDRVPSVQAGGGQRVGNPRVGAGALIYASEFGMNKRSGWYAAARYRGSAGRQYHRHLGRVGYWFFPTERRQRESIYRRWFDVCDRLLNKWGAGG